MSNGTIEVSYVGDDIDEDISLNISGKKFVFCELSKPAMTDGCTYGHVRHGYVFLTPDESRALGKELIRAADEYGVKHR